MPHIVTGPYHGESCSLWYVVREDHEDFDVISSYRKPREARDEAARLNRAPVEHLRLRVACPEGDEE